MSFTNEEIAHIAHDAARALQSILADPSIPVSVPWDQLPDESKKICESGVKVARNGASPEILHERWADEKRAAGWTHGETKDAEAKTHPLLVPFDRMSPGDQAKDILFAAICSAMNQAAEIKDRAENADRAQKDAVANALGVSPQAAAARMPFGGAAPVVVQAAAQEPERADG